MKITIEPTESSLKCFNCVLKTKVSVEVKEDDLAVERVLELMVRVMLAIGYKEDVISECLSDKFASLLGFSKDENDTLSSEPFYETSDAISKDFIKPEIEVNDSIFSYKNTTKD